MKRIAAGFLALVLSAGTLPAQADLVLTGRSTVLSMGMQGVGQENLWLRKTWMRRDLIERGKAYSHLYDLARKEITILDHSLRQADVYAMSTLNHESDAKVDTKDLTLVLSATGRKHMLQGWNCVEHQLQAAMPAEVGGEKMSFELTGQVWLAKNVPEQKETAAFVKATQTPEFFMGIPALVKSAPAQAKGMSEVVRRLAPMGLLCAADLETKYTGTGRMAALSQRMASRISLTYERYTTEPFGGDVFEIPAGYRVVRH